MAFGRPPGAILLINPDGTAVRRLEGSTNGSEPTRSPDGKRIAFIGAPKGPPQLYVINADGTGLKRLTRNRAEYEAPAWSPEPRAAG